MKKVLAFLLICLLCCPAALAAEWPEGRSAAQPTEGVPEVNLSESMGYAIRFPRDRAPAAVFCDALQIWLPREDIVRGKGNFVLHNGNEQTVIDFADEERVTIEPLDEGMLDKLHWGGGTCITVYLPVSLRLDTEYYVTMDEGCFRSVDGDIPSPATTERAEEHWIPVFSSDYAISGLYYSKGPGEGEEDQAGETIMRSQVQPGDKLTFDLVLGGDATVAVLFSDNGSVTFEQSEYQESATIQGTVIGDELDWGVAFLDDVGNVVDAIRLGE